MTTLVKKLRNIIGAAVPGQTGSHTALRGDITELSATALLRNVCDQFLASDMPEITCFSSYQARTTSPLLSNSL